MLNRIPLNLQDLYITQPLESETFQGAVKDGNFGTTNRLYYIANGIKESQDFMELVDHPSFTLSARVGMKCAYIGKARKQAEVIKYMARYMNVSPVYQVRVRLYPKGNPEVVFSFSHDTKNRDQVYKLTHILEDKIKELI